MILAVLEQLFVQQLDRLTLQLIADGCDQDSAAAVLDEQRRVHAAWRADLIQRMTARLAEP